MSVVVFNGKGQNMSDERRAEEGGEETDRKNMRLYNVLGLGKKATEDEIKKAYRKLALRYHPDKNLDGDPEKTEKFKEINYANAVLSNPQKRKVYDELGDAGLKLVEQFGDDARILRWILNPWIKWTVLVFGILSGCFCCCCCGCMFCCNCCCGGFCGKCKPADAGEEDQFHDIPPEDPSGDSPIIIIGQPMPTTQSYSEDETKHPVFAMPPPPPHPSGNQNSSPPPVYGST